MKRKYNDVSDGIDELVVIIFNFMEQNLILSEITELVYKSNYNIFDTKEECNTYVKVVMVQNFIN